MKLKHLKWKAYLSNEELITYILTTSPVEDDEDHLREYLKGASAKLKDVDISWVKRRQGFDLRNDPHIYAELSADTQPPIIVNQDGSIEDGQHRYEAAKKRGDKKLLAYVLE